MLFIRGLKEDSVKISKCDFCKYRWECKDKDDCKLEREKKEKKQNEKSKHQNKQ